MTNELLIDEIISDFFMETKPMCRVLDQRLATNFELNATIDMSELREEYMEYMKEKFDRRLFNMLRGSFHKFYNAYQGVWEFTQWLVKDEIIELDEEGISFGDDFYQNYLDFRTNINDVMFESIYDIACEKICNTELICNGHSQQSQQMLDVLKDYKSKAEC